MTDAELAARIRPMVERIVREVLESAFVLYGDALEPVQVSAPRPEREWKPR